jgi:NTE family protein
MRPLIGLALGSGGAKGLAHIGVLQVLLRERVPLDMIAGSSIGAIVGAAYAAGADFDILEKLARTINQSLFVDVTIPRRGLLEGNKILELIRLLTHNKDFSQLKVPLAVVATDLENGEKVVFRKGNVADAVRASMSVPGVFNPVRLNGRLLVDGAVSESVPILTLKEMGADFIIGVDVRTPGKVRVKNIYEVIMQSIDILEDRACRPSLEMADILIIPETSHISSADFNKADECINEGRRAAMEKMELLKLSLQKRVLLSSLNSLSSLHYGEREGNTY